MRRRQNRGGRLQMIVDALAMGADDESVRRLADASGGAPVEEHERRVGEPAVLSRHLLFAPGVELVLHDDALIAVILHLAPTPLVPRGLDVADWIAGVNNDATFSDFQKTFPATWRFAAGDRYFVLESGYVRPEFVKYGGSRAGDLQRVVITAEDPGLACRPADEDCPTCRDLVVRTGDGSFDVDGTIDALIAAVDAGELTEQQGAIPLADLRLLHASALMTQVESQATCTTCRRVACLTLPREGRPTFGYYPYDAAMRRPLEAVPPVEAWGDAGRVVRARDALRYLDHEPGSWFLVGHDDDLYLESRYTISSMAEGSSLIRLDDAERRQYRNSGHDYLTDLALAVDSSGPHKEGSSFHSRDLFRHSDGARDYPEEVRAAIANHTWLARQKQAAAQQSPTRPDA